MRGQLNKYCTKKMKAIANYSTKQRGYGRKSLYVDVVIDGEMVRDVYVQDVFPNVEEHFDYVLTEDATEHPDGVHFTNLNGNGKYDRTFNTTLEAIQYFVDVENLDIDNENE